MSGDNKTTEIAIPIGHIDQDTLSKIIQTSQEGFNISAVVSIPTALVADTIQPYTKQYMGQVWAVPDEKTKEKIENNNSGGYAFIECMSLGKPAILVLCEEYKIVMTDGSYKFSYIPVNIDSVKRM